MNEIISAYYELITDLMQDVIKEEKDKEEYRKLTEELEQVNLKFINIISHLPEEEQEICLEFIEVIKRVRDYENKMFFTNKIYKK